MSLPVRLVADIGATNARFALLDGDRPVRARVFACDDFPSLEDALAASAAAERTRADEAALAVASPVTGDTVTFTNHPWSFSIAALKARFALARLAVVNDFTANALAVLTRLSCSASSKPSSLPRSTSTNATSGCKSS